VAILPWRGGEAEQAVPPPVAHPAPREAPRGRRLLRIALVLAGVGIAAALFRSAGWPAIEANLVRIGPWFLALVALYTLAQVAFALGWWVLLEPRPPASRFPSLFAIYLAGDSANYLAPGNVAGEPLKAHLLRPETGAPAAMASLAIHKHADMLAQWAFLLAGITVALVRFPMPVAARVAALAGALVFGLLLLLLTRALRHGTYSLVLRRLARWKPLARRLDRLHSPAEAADRLVRDFYERHRGLFAASIGWCFLGWCGGLVESWLVLRLIAPGSGWDAAFAVEALAMTLNTMVFFIPARIGSAEGVRVAVFLLIGLTAAQGAAYGLVRRGRELAWVLPGLLVIARHHAFGGEAPAESEVQRVPARGPAS
jgi:uncharacterized protein (TIRG00374 family)